MHALDLRQGADGRARAHAACAGRRRLDVAGDRSDGKTRRGLHSGRGGCRAFLDQPIAGPEANDWAVLRCLGIAAQKLNDGDEAGAQRALDASGLTLLSSDGAVLMRAVAGSLGIGPLDLPWADGPRLWPAEDIAAHLPLFKDHAPAHRKLGEKTYGTIYPM